jgi:hypothetical protein
VFATARYNANPLVITGPERAGGDGGRSQRHPPAGGRTRRPGRSPRSEAWATWARARHPGARGGRRRRQCVRNGPASRASGAGARPPEPPTRPGAAHRRLAARAALAAAGERLPSGTGLALTVRKGSPPLAAKVVARLGSTGAVAANASSARRRGPASSRPASSPRDGGRTPPRQHRALPARRHRAHPLHGAAGCRAAPRAG